MSESRGQQRRPRQRIEVPADIMDVVHAAERTLHGRCTYSTGREFKARCGKPLVIFVVNPDRYLEKQPYEHLALACPEHGSVARQRDAHNSRQTEEPAAAQAANAKETAA